MKIEILLLLILGLAIIPHYHCDKADDDADDDADGIVEEEDDSKEKVKYKPPSLKGNAYLAETFDSKEDFQKRWTLSQAKKDGTDETIAKYDGKWSLEEPLESAMEGDLGLVLKSKAKHHAVSARLKRPFEFKGKPFIVQYEVKFQNGIDCGGAYVKLLSHDPKFDPKNFQDKTPYTIMFGPDKCGMDHKYHFIFRHRNPKTGEYEEKHAKKPSKTIDTHFSDKKTHLYTLVVNPDNTYEMLIDNMLVNEGSLLEDFTPPVNPPSEIDDPNDKKPEDWDDKEKIVDPDAEKPEDWDESEPEKIVDETAEMPDGWLEDEPELVPDPDAEKPKDWDDDMDGEWEAPLINNKKCEGAPGCGKWEKPTIKNPKYKGKWRPPLIDNPNYKGVWKPRRIQNPDFFEDLKPYKMTTIGALGLELWSMTDNIVFDNFIVTDDRAVAETWAAESWEIKIAQEKAGSSGRSVVDAVLDVTKDRPWLWAVILVVVVLPIVLIIAYCCMSKSQEGLLYTLRKAAEDYPVLWALYIVVLLLPILLLSICLCPRNGPITPEKIAAHKKTDEDTPEDVSPEQTEEKELGDTGAGGDNSVNTTKKSKADLETEETNDDEEEEEEGEEKEANEEGDAAASKDSPRRSSPRKRKSRKE